MSDLATEDIIFDGTGAADKLIRAVRKAAFNHGKHEDDVWCAQFASTCLEGSALAVYEEFEEKTRGSWKLLRRALLERFPMMTLSSLEPTPPAAGPSTLDPTPVAHSPAAANSKTAASIRGFIRVVDMRSVTLGYLSNIRSYRFPFPFIDSYIERPLVNPPTSALGSDSIKRLAALVQVPPGRQRLMS